MDLDIIQRKVIAGAVARDIIVDKHLNRLDPIGNHEVHTDQLPFGGEIVFPRIFPSLRRTVPPVGLDVAGGFLG